jgi:ABC-type iron transport system FetAB ATPase subunit
LLLPQSPVFFSLSVREALANPFSFSCSRLSFPEEEARRLLDRVGLAAAFGAPEARDLSLGERQRLSLVRGLLVSPRVLLLDEPTSSLDPESIEAVEDLLAEQVGKGMAMLLVTHREAQARRLADREIDLRTFVSGGGL